MKKIVALSLLIIALIAGNALAEYNTDRTLTKAQWQRIESEIKEVLELPNSPYIRVYVMHAPGEDAFLLGFLDTDGDTKADRVVVFHIGYFSEDGEPMVKPLMELTPEQAEQAIQKHELQVGKGKV
jgi:hypothetical protein